jgi:hypothetical protein
VDKKRARLNCISHLLQQVPYEDSPHDEIVLPPRERSEDYRRNDVPDNMIVPEKY